MIVVPSILSRTREPALSLADAKQHLRLLHTSDEDSYVTDLVLAAQDFIEDRTDRTFTEATYTSTFESFPADECLWLSRPPVSDATITYWSNGTIRTFTDFTLCAAGEIESYIEVGDGGWPSTDDRPDAITIEYTAGKSAAECPAAVRHAIRLLIGTWYSNRESITGAKDRSGGPVEHSLNALIGVLKSGRTGGGYANNDR